MYVENEYLCTDIWVCFNNGKGCVVVVVVVVGLVVVGLSERVMEGENE